MIFYEKVTVQIDKDLNKKTCKFISWQVMVEIKFMRLNERSSLKLLMHGYVYEQVTFHHDF